MKDADQTDESDTLDMGQPITELKLLQVKPKGDWLSRIRTSISHKLLLADGLDFCLKAMTETFLVYLGSIMSMFAKGDSKSDKTRRP